MCSTVEPAITDVNALGVLCAPVNPERGSLRVRRIVRRPVFEAPRPGDGQAARGAHFAGEQVRGCPAAFIARVPHLEHGADVLEPGHRDRLAGIEHDDGVLVDRRDFRDQAILIAGQAKERPIAAPGEHHREFRSARGFDGVSERASLHFRCDPGKTNLNRITAPVGLRLDRDGMRARAQFHGAPQVVETIGGRNDIVAIGEHDVAVSAPPPHLRDDLAVEAQLPCRSEKLQIDFVVPRGRH